VSTSSFPTDEHPYVTLAKEIAGKYVRAAYTLDPEANVDVEFELVDSLWVFGTWYVGLECNLDDLVYRVRHNGTSGEVISTTPSSEEQEPNG
jgi:hypothetical protein